MTATTVERVLTVTQAARHFGVDDGTVYRMVADKELRAIRVGRLIRIPESALADFIAGKRP